MGICEGMPRFTKYCGCIPLREGALIASVINSIVMFLLSVIFAYLALFVDQYGSIEKSIFGLLTATALIGFMCYLLLLMGVVRHSLDEAYFWITACLILAELAGAVAACFLTKPALAALSWVVTGEKVRLILVVSSWLSVSDSDHYGFDYSLVPYMCIARAR